jgi:tRNA(Ile)-lysidine synthase
MVPAPELIERFRRNLDPLVPADARLGLAVSGGPDSLALLLLAAAARPGLVEAATVDHGLRAESPGEAKVVAGLCEQLGVPYAILTVTWKRKPETAIQERARVARYRLLGAWAKDRDLGALATAHHLDDQVETFVMRLTRGAGIQGLAGMRRAVAAPGSDVRLTRPLLGWRRFELEKICADAGLTPVEDPSNLDPQFERVRVRQALARLPEIDTGAVGRSLAHLGQADAALRWAAGNEWQRAVTAGDQEVVYRPDGAPLEIRRRIVARAIGSLANEGRGTELRGRELDRVLLALRSGGKATLRGVLCSGGEQWRFIPAPDRTRPANNLR